MRFSLATLMVISLLSLPVPGQGNLQTFPNAPKGFDKQYKSVFRAYEKGDEKELVERFHTFAIPERWFTEEFGPEDGPKLYRQYLYRFRDFETGTVEEFNRVSCDYDGGCNRGQVTTRAAKATELNQAHPVPRSPLSGFPVQRFRIRHFSVPEVNSCFSIPGEYTTCSAYGYSTVGTHDNAWISSFLYVDGAFRFVGCATCPFWGACAGNVPIPERVLEKPPEPVHFNLMQKSQSRDLLAWIAKLAGKSH